MVISINCLNAVALSVWDHTFLLSVFWTHGIICLVKLISARSHVLSALLNVQNLTDLGIRFFIILVKFSYISTFVCWCLNCISTVLSHWWATISARYMCLVRPVLLSSYLSLLCCFSWTNKWIYLFRQLRTTVVCWCTEPSWPSCHKGLTLQYNNDNTYE